MNIDEALSLLEERAAIEEENKATEAQRIKSIQEERRRIRDALVGDLSLHQANIKVMELEKQADVYGEVRGLRL